MEETSVPNLVTAVLADYRGFDTMFETTVIFAAGIACMMLLKNIKPKSVQARLYRHNPTGLTLRIEKGGRIPAGSKEFERIDALWTPYDLIIKTTCCLLVPFIQLFGLYVIAHGHHSPGGGFQGGVILGASLILYAITHDLRATFYRFSEKTGAYIAIAGVLLYAGTGAVCLLFGGNFLDYGVLAPLFGVDPIAARSLGILIVEIGVGMAVMAVMVSLYYYLSSVGNLDEGL